MSANGWMLIRLGRLGKDIGGGQITKISPTGDLVATAPALRWRDAAIVGITDDGRGVYRMGTELFLLGSIGEGVPLLRLDQLGVTSDLSNLADVALAADGRLAVLVGNGREPDSYRLFVRSPDGAGDGFIPIARSALFGRRPGGSATPLAPRSGSPDRTWSSPVMPG